MGKASRNRFVASVTESKWGLWVIAPLGGILIGVCINCGIGHLRSQAQVPAYLATMVKPGKFASLEEAQAEYNFKVGLAAQEKNNHGHVTLTNGDINTLERFLNGSPFDQIAILNDCTLVNDPASLSDLIGRIEAAKLSDEAAGLLQFTLRSWARLPNGKAYLQRCQYSSNPQVRKAAENAAAALASGGKEKPKSLL